MADWLKLVGGLSLFGCIVFFGIIPIKWHAFRANRTLLSLSNCFSGGLFVAIGLIHILPEAAELLERKKQPDDFKNGVGHGDDPFPWSYFISLCCFSFVLLVDKVLFSPQADIPEEKIDLRRSFFKKSHIEPEDPEENFKELVSIKHQIGYRVSQLGMNHPENENDDDHDHDEEHGHDHAHDHHGHHEENRDKQDEDKLDKKRDKPLHENLLAKSDQVRTKSDKKSHGDHGHHGHHGHTHTQVKKGDSFITAYLLLLAMGVHGIFAGLAFGISKDDTEILSMYLAMIAHKWSEALTVGISFVNAELPDLQSIFLVIFLALLTPIGIFLGWMLSSMNDTVQGVCMALSSGTFIYISCAEIIVEEFSMGKNRFWKFLAYSLGIAFVVMLYFIE